MLPLQMSGSGLGIGNVTVNVTSVDNFLSAQDMARLRQPGRLLEQIDDGLSVPDSEEDSAEIEGEPEPD
jgi:hypothetical protein